MNSDQKPDEEFREDAPGKGAGSAKPGAKKSYALRLDEQTYKAIEHWAADEFRSVNGQLEWIIDQALKTAKRSKAPRKGKTDAGHEAHE